MQFISNINIDIFSISYNIYQNYYQTEEIVSEKTILDEEYGFCRHGHLKKCSPDLIFGTPSICKCGEPISIFISENGMQKKLKQLREADKTKSYKTVSDLKIKFQETKIGGKNSKLAVYDLNKLGCNYELPPDVKNLLPRKKIKDEDAIEAKKNRYPPRSLLYFLQTWAPDKSTLH